MTSQDQCAACGERNSPGSTFCQFCGEYLGWDKLPGGAPASTPPPPQPGTPPSPPAPAAPQPPTTDLVPRGTPGPTPPTPTSNPAAAPVPEEARRPPPVPPSQTACPSCGTGNDLGRRFCGRCGTSLVLAGAPPVAAGAPEPPPTWWSRLRDPQERAARRAYRRSLPPLYRWRRFIIGVLVVVGLTVLLTATGRDPVGWAKARWYDLTGRTETVPDITATEQPEAEPPLRDFAPRLAVDGDPRTAWATRWPAADATAEVCGTTPDGASTLVLSLAEPTRVRGLEILAGLREGNSAARLNQFRPRRVYLTYDGGCVPIELTDSGEPQVVDFTTDEEVDALTFVIASTYPPEGNQPLDLVAISDVVVLRRPQ